MFCVFILFVNHHTCAVFNYINISGWVALAHVLSFSYRTFVQIEPEAGCPGWGLILFL
jgi:hypothetical protein